MNRLSSLYIGIFSLTILFACKGDDSRSCTSCSSPNTSDFEVCEESDGNASVNGENTGTPFDVYVSGLETAGAICGGS